MADFVSAFSDVTRSEAHRHSAGPLIALVGCDGSGKSTVGEALREWMNARRPTVFRHLGQQSGNLGRALAGLPIVGRLLGHTIGSKVKRARGGRGPGALAAIVIYGFALRRLGRFVRMQAERERGFAIIADRFPQIDVPSAIDGPGFARVKTDRRIARTLAWLERRHFEWMTSRRPDLVIRLNVDVATAIARKPDHDAASLTAKVATLPFLNFGGSIPIVDIDATGPLDVVVSKAKKAITHYILDNRTVSPGEPIEVTSMSELKRAIA